ncbi:hypothetical protein XENOCAPTIV_026410 [Xenoophorus captivus]|uniref:Secreted protein n=1 Tax=Xenoophorus captivus TaxID=1517983 RepID=A0ABV0QFM2_9TELE
MFLKQLGFLSAAFSISSENSQVVLIAISCACVYQVSERTWTPTHMRTRARLFMSLPKSLTPPALLLIKSWEQVRLKEHIVGSLTHTPCGLY